jgi:hypothetical protein
MSKAARGNPSEQPFNVAARYNKTKNRLRTWWGHAPFHNNGTKKAER